MNFFPGYFSPFLYPSNSIIVWKESWCLYIEILNLLVFENRWTTRYNIYKIISSHLDSSLYIVKTNTLKCVKLETTKILVKYVPAFAQLVALAVHWNVKTTIHQGRWCPYLGSRSLIRISNIIPLTIFIPTEFQINISRFFFHFIQLMMVDPQRRIAMW